MARTLCKPFTESHWMFSEVSVLDNEMDLPYQDNYLETRNTRMFVWVHYTT